MGDYKSKSSIFIVSIGIFFLFFHLFQSMMFYSRFYHVFVVSSYYYFLVLCVS